MMRYGVEAARRTNGPAMAPASLTPDGPTIPVGG